MNSYQAVNEQNRSTHLGPEPEVKRQRRTFYQNAVSSCPKKRVAFNENADLKNVKKIVPCQEKNCFAYSIQSVTFKDKSVFPCSRPSYGGWMGASLQHDKPGDGNCRLLCRPAIGMSEMYEIFVPCDCSCFNKKKSPIGSKIPCQFPLVLSQSGSQTAAEGKSSEKLHICSIFNPNRPDINDDSSCSSQPRVIEITDHITESPQCKTTPNILSTTCNKSGEIASRQSSVPGPWPGRVVRVTGDGRCLFRSLAVCVAPLLQTARRDRYGTPIRQKYAETETLSADTLRRLMVEFMHRQAKNYQAMDTHVLNADQPVFRFPTFAARLSAMSKPGTYAGEMEINAVADVIRRPVLVLDQQLRYINVYGAEKHRHASACVLRFTRVSDYAGHYDAVILTDDVTGGDLCRKSKMITNGSVFSDVTDKYNLQARGRIAQSATPIIRKRSSCRAPRMLAKAEYHFHRDPCKMGLANSRTRRSPTSRPSKTRSASGVSAGDHKCVFCKRKLRSNSSRIATCFYCDKIAHRACARTNWAFWCSDLHGAKFVCKKCCDI